MIASTAPIVSAFAQVNALNGPDLGLRIHCAPTAATIIAMHMPTIGWLRKKNLIVGNSRSWCRVHHFGPLGARVVNPPSHIDGISAVHVLNAAGSQEETQLVRFAEQCQNTPACGIRRGIGNGEALRSRGELDRRRQILSRTDTHHAAMPTRSLRQC